MKEPVFRGIASSLRDAFFCAKWGCRLRGTKKGNGKSQKALARTLPSKAGTESFNENLSPGIYFWRLEMAEGGGWLVGKLLVLRG